MSDQEQYIRDASPYDDLPRDHREYMREFERELFGERRHLLRAAGENTIMPNGSLDQFDNDAASVSIRHLYSWQPPRDIIDPERAADAFTREDGEDPRV